MLANEGNAMDLESLASLLGPQNFQAVAPDGRLWRSSVQGDGRELPLWLKITDSHWHLAIRGFLGPADAGAELGILRRLMQLNDELSLAKFSADKEGKLSLALSLSAEGPPDVLGLRLQAAVGLLAYYIRRYDRELGILSKSSPATLPGLKPIPKPARRTVVLDGAALQAALAGDSAAPPPEDAPAERVLDLAAMAKSAKPMSPVWSFQAGSPLVGSPGLFGDRILIASADGSIFALGLQRGVKKWRFAADDLPSSPKAVGEVFFCGAGSSLLAGDLRSGRRLWRYHLSCRSTFGPPEIAGGAVIAGASNGKVYCLDAERGAVAWSFQGQAPMASAPVIHEGVVYAVAVDGHIYALDFMSGAERARFMIPGGAESLAFAAPAIYASSEGRLLACDLAERRCLWTAEDESFTKSRSAPSLGDAQVYFNVGKSNSHKLWAVDRRTGRRAYSAAVDAWDAAPSVGRQGEIFVARGPWVYALDRGTAEIRRSAEVDAAVTTAIGDFDPGLVVGTESGNVVCLR